MAVTPPWWRPPRCVITSALLLWLCVWQPSPARAFTILTGLSDGCHETLTLAAVLLAGFDIEPLGVPVPKGTAWAQVSDWIEETYPTFVDLAATEGERVMLVSLLVGVRSNDTQGHSALNLGLLREIHASTEGQSEHCLRSDWHDGVEGNAPALDDCRATLRGLLDNAFLALLDTPPEQLKKVPFTSDFYGQFEVTVWAPAFWLGKALHVVQDSFTHTLRTQDLRRVVHVMNYVEAIQADFDESVEGVRHSDSMDTCSVALAPGDAPADNPTLRLVEGAMTASTDLLVAAANAIWGFDDQAIGLFEDKWMRLYDCDQDPDATSCPCDEVNDYCDSPFLEHAREEPTTPYLDGIIGCGGGPAPAPPWPAWPIALAALAIARWRRP